jgi:hypothetical protein
MALDQSALLEVLDALTVADVGDRVRQAAETIAHLNPRQRPEARVDGTPRTAQVSSTTNGGQGRRSS